MISKSAAEVAINIAQEFDKRRIVLAPTEGTPLAELVASSDVSAQGILESEYVPDADFIVAASAGYSDDGASRHDQLLDGFAADIAPAVAQHLTFAKNVVRPVISELVEGIQGDIAALPVDVQFNLNVVQRALPAPMSSAAIADLVAEFAETNYEPIRSYIPGQEKSFEEIVELMATGAADTDELVAAWAASKGHMFFQSVWNSVFTANESSVRFDALIQDEVEGLDSAVTVFLLTKRLYDNPPEGVAMSLVDYNQTIADLRNQSALRIIHGYEAQQRAAKSGLLVLKVTNNEIVVNADVYNGWINANGNNAVLFGSALSDRPVRFVNDLNERSEEFKALWEQRNRLLTARERNNRFVNYKTILRERGEKVIGDNMAAIFATVAGEGETVSKDLPAYQLAITTLNEIADNAKEADFKDIWTLATQVVCRSAFHFTDAEKILAGIDQACRDNPGIEVREAALISLVEYVVDWVCDQMIVKRV